VEPFTKRVIEIIKAIPEGKVMTYGQIAQFAGSPRAARQVVRILHSMSQKYRLPWHRVVNARGEIQIADEEARAFQRLRLELEGITFKTANSIRLADVQYAPVQEEWSGIEAEEGLVGSDIVRKRTRRQTHDQR